MKFTDLTNIIKQSEWQLEGIGNSDKPTHKLLQTKEGHNIAHVFIDYVYNPTDGVYIPRDCCKLLEINPKLCKELKTRMLLTGTLGTSFKEWKM